MCERQHPESLAASPVRTTLAQCLIDEAEERLQYEQPDDEREEHWRQSVRSLQEWICEFLIKNQELRMSLLDSATNEQSWEADQ